MVLRNLKSPIYVASQPVASPDNGANKTGAIPPIMRPDGGGLGMVIGILRIPACLQIDFNFLEGLKRNKIVDYYEVQNFNSEIVLYWRQMRPAEVKTVQIDLIQRYQGTCLQKPHSAYPYYNNDQAIWVTAAKA
jgi:hypothetical protein